MKFKKSIPIFIIVLLVIISAASCKQNNEGKGDEDVPVIEKIEYYKPTAEELTAATQTKIKEIPTTFCNPVNIGYAYQPTYKTREGADPVIILFRGEYYLFVSHSSGYWYSSDLVDWKFISVTLEGYPESNHFAPGLLVVDDTMYITTTGGDTMYRTKDPKSGIWKVEARDHAWGDPAMFIDDDSSIYMYSGLSDMFPIIGHSLSLLDMKRTGPQMRFIYCMPELHGFEVAGNDNTQYEKDTWIEGAWMTKHEGKYYLQYAVPGTEYSAYANGVYVADSPKGPFTFGENSPLSYKNTGFVRGAGHGSTFTDMYGNYWKIDTASISVNTDFERRLIMYPASFDKYGQMVTNMVLSDYPIYVPNENFDFDNPGPDWNLLSYGKTVTASTEYDEDHAAAYAVDENMKTWWAADAGDAGEWLMMDMGKICDVRAVQLNFADYKCTTAHIEGRNYDYIYKYTIEFSQDGETWYTFIDKSDAEGEAFTDKDKSHDYFELEDYIGARYFKVTNKGEAPAEGVFAISGLRIFGYGNNELPKETQNIKVARYPDDDRAATITWDKAENAEGYIIRYGNKEDSKYIHKQVIGETSIEIYNLNVGIDYYFTIDSYNDSGYVKGTTVMECKALKPYLEIPGDYNELYEYWGPYIEEVYPITILAGNAELNGYELEDYKNANEGTALKATKENAEFTLKNLDGGATGRIGFWMTYACADPDATVELIINGVSYGEHRIPTTGKWDKFRTMKFNIENGRLNAGTDNTVTVKTTKGKINVDYMQFT